jgi:pyruvate/2-oxoglutarate dehydrogenase complex dihydrolipoamide dehydrogenase (E3) component
MDPRSFDVLIIGGGQAGIPLARALAGKGQRVALAERKHLGGSCVNFGCTPTKAAIASARLAQMARRGAEFGIELPEPKIDFAAVLERARSIALKSRASLDERMQSSDNPALLRGHIRFEGRDRGGFRLRLADEKFVAGIVVLDTGTRSMIPPIDGIEDIDFLHASNWLDKPQRPQRLVMVGGSYIGLEMAQFYRRMGSEVVVVESVDQIMEREDSDIATTLQRLLQAEGIAFRLSSQVKRVSSAGGRLLVQIDSAQEGLVEASHVFIATGRKPNTDELGLETVGVELSEKGIVTTNERLATTVEGIYAAGDIRGGPMFTHTSWDDYRVLESQLAGDGSRTTDRVVPYAVFTDPALGRVGMTEKEAQQAGRRVKVGSFEMSNNGKAAEIGESGGVIKVVIDADDDRLLGAAVLAHEGGELVHTLIDLMNARAPCSVVRDAVYIHPTLAEAVQSAVSAAAQPQTD